MDIIWVLGQILVQTSSNTGFLPIKEFRLSKYQKKKKKPNLNFPLQTLLQPIRNYNYHTITYNCVTLNSSKQLIVNELCKEANLCMFLLLTLFNLFIKYPQACSSRISYYTSNMTNCCT